MIFGTPDASSDVTPPPPSLKSLQQWLTCRSVNLTQVGADGKNPITKERDLWESVKPLRRVEIVNAERGDDEVFLRSPDGECLHEILLARGSASAISKMSGQEAFKSIHMDSSRWALLFGHLSFFGKMVPRYEYTHAPLVEE